MSQQLSMSEVSDGSHSNRVDGAAIHHTRRLALLRVSALGVVVALILALSGGGSVANAATKKGGSHSLVVAYANLPTTFAGDGAAPGGYENFEFGVNTEVGLIRQAYKAGPASCGCLVQDQYHFQPVLASSYDVSADKLTYTFHLRQGVKSAAGDPLTADDVIWSFQRKFNAATATAPNVFDPAITDPSTQIKEINASTVAITVAKPGYGFTLLSTLANIAGYIYDSKLLKQHVTPADPYAVNWSEQNPNFGFGAYERTSFTPGTEMVLTANPNYVFGPPYYKKITFRVTADPGTRANTVKFGAADIATQLRPADQITLAKTPGVKVYTFPETNMTTMLTMDMTKPPFDNVQVRQAMALAVPYQQILKNVYYGRGVLTKGLLDPKAPNYVGTGMTNPQFDPAKAKQLLAAAGYPHGLSFTLSVSSSVPDVSEAAIQVQSYAQQAGFNITINQQPPAVISEGITGRKFDAFMWRDMMISSSPSYDLTDRFKLAANGTGPSLDNNSGWVNQQFWSFINQGLDLSDPTSPAASQLWDKAALVQAQDVGMIYVGRIQPLNAFRAGIGGYANRLDNDIDYSMLKSA
jgi:peptide/nickel transport system substrate-binding protein